MKPLISVGMPVYNEEKYLRESIESILDQDYDNFELIISDNASSDGTERICRDLAIRDTRIKYSRNIENIGAIDNFNKVFIEAKGDYFMFAGGHDLWSNNFMSSCLDILQSDSSSVISFASTVWIDEENNPVKKRSLFYDTGDSDPVTRFMYVLWGPMNPVYGLIRTDSLRKVRLDTKTIGADLILLSELSFLGQFSYNSEAVWFRRIKHGEETREQKIIRYQNVLFSKGNKLLKIMPHVKIPFELWRSIAKADLSLKDKIYIYMISLIAFPVKYFLSKK